MWLLLKRNFPVVPFFVSCIILIFNVNFLGKSFAKNFDATPPFDENMTLISIEGKSWWGKKLGPKNSSLKKCDLGLGPGVVKGAVRSLPRFFHDTGLVQDIKSRLIFCMIKHQGFKERDVKTKPDFKKIITSIVVWLNESAKNENFSVPLINLSEEKLYVIGKNIFFFNFPSANFSLSSCLTGGQDNAKVLSANHFIHKNAKLALSMFPKYQQENNKVLFIEDQISKCFFKQGIVNKSFHDFSYIPLLVFLGVNAGSIRQDIE